MSSERNIQQKKDKDDLDFLITMIRVTLEKASEDGLRRCHDSLNTRISMN